MTELLRVVAGSRAYGLEDQNSDYDYHAVHVVPTRDFLRLGKSYPPRIGNTRWQEGSTDVQSWEVGHFLHLALQSNPAALETMTGPVGHSHNVWGVQLQELFPLVISRQRVFESFKGYASNQRKKMFDPPAERDTVEVRERKFAVAYLRVLWQGARLLSAPGEYTTYIHDEHFRLYLRQVRQGAIRKGEIIDRAEQLLHKMAEANITSNLQEEPDYDTVNDVLFQIRKEYW